ncbi:MAG TPA: hypothetical protein VEK79_16895 [Thermoanaerobaculia bacterium]|nr:hypothetical protein [Thermoanaerobaculia bacterium]
MQSDTHGYMYAGANPTNVTDPLGLQPAQCQVSFLKTKPLPGGFCPYFGTCQGLVYPTVYLVGGLAKFGRCDICPIECQYFAEILPIIGTISRWGMKCSWAW